MVSCAMYSRSRVREKKEHHHFVKYGAKHLHNRFESTVRYADCTCPKHIFENRMGNLDVYFDNVDRYEGGTEVMLANHMGRIVVHVPAKWCIECSVKNHTGQVTAKRGAADGKKIYITGTNHMGQILVDTFE